MNRAKRETTKPERFSDIQLSMNKGVYHGWTDTYQRVYIKQEKLINANTNYSKPLTHSGYKDDGFVVSDSLEEDFEVEEVEEAEIESDDDSEEEEFEEEEDESESDEEEEEE
jgi:hypothetical protein